MKDFKNRGSLKEKFGYLKKLLWVFLILLAIFNIILFYFINWFYYFLALIIFNIIFVWILTPVFIWISKTYLIDSTFDIVNDKKDEMATKYKDDIIQVVEKK